ncbi:IS110 family transposase [Flavobacterium oreochromis]|uniref:IS110 family transposase n=1 Tax=Flavobacterium oreochromis TaxID=2906078 RepID=UPI001CE60441|nr:IS110 family transposase [Flavobacterium oreochromis]QYS85998.1 IS110 family transposase [Flavobacterium oreochromis]
MNKFNHFIGIDISKEYFDATLLVESNIQKHNQFANSVKGVKGFLKWLKQENASIENTLICMEHTGMYSKVLSSVLLAKNCNTWIEMSLKIIRSSGLQRGKNDKIDSERIALYAFKNQDEVTLFKAPKKSLEKIRVLLSLREKMVAFKATLITNVNELKLLDKELYRITQKHQKQSIKGINQDIKKIEKDLETLILEDEKLNSLYNTITSVPGVGKVTALSLICFTKEFTTFQSPRQLACYCGVVPFEYTSGKSIRAKPKVHFMANKKLKKQLHMCALSCVMHNPEMKIYYQRKVAEGKSKMLVLNNVRNKLVHIICACVRENRHYQIREVA